MGAQALLCFDIENGEKVVDALDKAGKPPNVAIWAKLPDYEDWRLVIASDRLDQSSEFQVIRRSMRQSARPAFRFTGSQ
jgi:prophage tail gpP-like protein